MLLTGFNIANVELVKIVTKETVPRTLWFKTASSFTATAAVSAGTEVEQRIKNTIMGLLKTDDIVKGYDIDFEDQRLLHEVFALVDGGVDTVDTGWQKYASPVAGSPSRAPRLIRRSTRRIAERTARRRGIHRGSLSTARASPFPWEARTALSSRRSTPSNRARRRGRVRWRSRR